MEVQLIGSNRAVVMGADPKTPLRAATILKSQRAQQWLGQRHRDLPQPYRTALKVPKRSEWTIVGGKRSDWDQALFDRATDAFPSGSLAARRALLPPPPPAPKVPELDNNSSMKSA